VVCTGVLFSGSPPNIDPMKVFSRDALGRQSMSEKRKGHVDPRVSSFYQNLKAVKGTYQIILFHSADGEICRYSKMLNDNQGTNMFVFFGILERTDIYAVF